MNILVTGATGFIGRYLVPVLLANGHSVTAVGRDYGNAQTMPWFAEVDFINCDIHKADACAVLGVPEMMVHLAWSGLSDYKAFHHFEKTLPADFYFLKSMVERGLSRVLVAGTCLEYGMQSGALLENIPTFPVTSYGKAKDFLRERLQVLQTEISFNLQWARLFYTYGAFQNPNSLIAQLDQAIDNGEQIFNMSGGEQLRDYLSIEKLAERLALLIDRPECCGVVNCCKGSPISVMNLVEQLIKEREAVISLNLGYYQYPDYEPMEFWGDCTKLNSFARTLVP